MAFLLIGLMASCTSAPEGKKVEAEAKKEVKTAVKGTNYSVDTAGSFINWTGKKIAYGHSGNLKLSNGKLSVSNGNIVAGKFDIDMTSINCTDLEGDKKADLEGHLNGTDFFDVEQFKTGSFVITSVTPETTTPDVTHNVTGNLTLKGVTKSVTIPASIAIVDNTLSAVTPAFTTNRTEWGINYSSGILGPAKDKIINEPASPCGACRQVIAEMENKHQQNIKVILQGETGEVFEFKSIKAILPFGFDSSFLS